MSYIWRLPVLHALVAWIAGVAAFGSFSQLPSALRWGVRLLLLVLVIHAVSLVVRAVRGAMARPRSAVFVGLAIIIGAGIPYLCAEAASWFWLRAKSGGRGPFALTEAQVKAAEDIIAGHSQYTMHSRELGWVVKPGGKATGYAAKANAQGIRADREYALKKPDGIVRALCFGDSFTHCDEVANDQTWEHYAEQTGGMEFLNFGVGGYGMTQALLRYLHEGRRFETDVVILGCMSNDVRRSVNAYYPFRLTDPSESPNVMGIPYSTLDASGGLVLNPNPLPDADAYRELLANPGKRLRELSRLDLLFHPAPPTPMLTLIKSKAGDEITEAWSDFSFQMQRNFNAVIKSKSRVTKELPIGEDNVFDTRSPVFTINLRLFDRFVSEVKSAGAKPLILWLPGRKDFARQREGREMVYKPFADYLKAKSYDFIDVMDWIAADLPGEKGVAPDKELFVISHYSPKVNQVIGHRIADHVRELIAGKQR